MTSTLPFIEQAYWWLSLIAGLHCLLQCLVFLGSSWRKPTSQRIMLSAIFGLLCLFFIDGVLGVVFPEPWRTFFGVVTASASLFILPLCYQYYVVSLYPEQNATERKNPHFISACIIVVFVLMAYVVDPSIVTHSFQNPKTIVWFSGIERVSETLPILLFIQVGVYLVLMYRLLGGYKYQSQKTQTSLSTNQACHWLYVVTGFIFVNWLLAVPGLVFVQLLNWKLESTVEVIMHFTWLLSLYLLTLYRLQQLINMHVERNESTNSSKQKPPILNEEEQDYIASVIRDKD
ncbi:hypothetical protein D5018_06445 [Parashewanella curva]|uniref:Uncharacterized protein n=1 Tax=Parashewanella curva TaxID=2338552 RepID=A0A3L8Q1I0_9GAMM|nr:hypothetical protein [Parashewanella curva]RLV60583.1 hypothetical protein D5018_06445 [Parashewanella curva]